MPKYKPLKKVSTLTMWSIGSSLVAYTEDRGVWDRLKAVAGFRFMSLYSNGSGVFGWQGLFPESSRSEVERILKGAKKCQRV